MIQLEINGERREFEAGVSVAELLERLEVRAPAIAVEVNRDIVPRSAYGEHRLTDGDRVEIVTFVGGG